MPDYSLIVRNASFLLDGLLLSLTLTLVGVIGGLAVGTALALAFYTSGRLAELFRAGLQAVPRGQRMAADATGMNRTQALRYIVIDRKSVV